MDLAKRALITLIRVLAVAYGVTANVTRESPDPAVVTAYRRLSLKVHPDRGGSKTDQQKLTVAHDKWQQAKREAPGRGKKKTEAEAESCEGVTRSRFLFPEQFLFGLAYLQMALPRS